MLGRKLRNTFILIFVFLAGNTYGAGCDALRNFLDLRLNRNVGSLTAQNAGARMGRIIDAEDFRVRNDDGTFSVGTNGRYENGQFHYTVDGVERSTDVGPDFTGRFRMADEIAPAADAPEVLTDIQMPRDPDLSAFEPNLSALPESLPDGGPVAGRFDVPQGPEMPEMPQRFEAPEAPEVSFGNAEGVGTFTDPDLSLISPAVPEVEASGLARAAEPFTPPPRMELPEALPGGGRIEADLPPQQLPTLPRQVEVETNIDADFSGQGLGDFTEPDPSLIGGGIPDVGPNRAEVPRLGNDPAPLDAPPSQLPAPAASGVDSTALAVIDDAAEGFGESAPGFDDLGDLRIAEESPLPQLEAPERLAIEGPRPEALPQIDTSVPPREISGPGNPDFEPIPPSRSLVPVQPEEVLAGSRPREVTPAVVPEIEPIPPSRSLVPVQPEEVLAGSRPREVTPAVIPELEPIPPSRSLVPVQPEEVLAGSRPREVTPAVIPELEPIPPSRSLVPVQPEEVLAGSRPREVTPAVIPETDPIPPSRSLVPVESPDALVGSRPRTPDDGLRGGTELTLRESTPLVLESAQGGDLVTRPALRFPSTISGDDAVVPFRDPTVELRFSDDIRQLDYGDLLNAELGPDGTWRVPGTFSAADDVAETGDDLAEVLRLDAPLPERYQPQEFVDIYRNRTVTVSFGDDVLEGVVEGVEGTNIRFRTLDEQTVRISSASITPDKVDNVDLDLFRRQDAEIRLVTGRGNEIFNGPFGAVDDLGEAISDAEVTRMLRSGTRLGRIQNGIAEMISRTGRIFKLDLRDLARRGINFIRRGGDGRINWARVYQMIRAGRGALALAPFLGLGDGTPPTEGDPTVEGPTDPPPEPSPEGEPEPEADPPPGGGEETPPFNEGPPGSRDGGDDDPEEAEPYVPIPAAPRGNPVGPSMMPIQKKTIIRMNGVY